MKEKRKTTKTPPLTFFQRRLAGGWFFFPSLYEGKNRPLTIR